VGHSPIDTTKSKVVPGTVTSQTTQLDNRCY